MHHWNGTRRETIFRVFYLTLYQAPVAQLDRALASGAKGREFESRRARHYYSTSYDTACVLALID